MWAFIYEVQEGIEGRKAHHVRGSMCKEADAREISLNLRLHSLLLTWST